VPPTQSLDWLPKNAGTDCLAFITAQPLGIASEKTAPPLRTAAGKTGTLTERRMTRTDALRMIWRRARAAGIETELGCHSFRATGITVYLMNGGLLEHAQQMAAHESARTTKLYDRRNDKVTLDEVEKIML
jgi:integrase